MLLWKQNCFMSRLQIKQFEFLYQSILVRFWLQYIENTNIFIFNITLPFVIYFISILNITRKIAPFGCFFLAATEGPFGPNNRALRAHLQMLKIHLENFAEICLNFFAEIYLEKFAKIYLENFA